MAVGIGIQQPPLPLYSIGTPLAFNYLPTPHATLRGGLWRSDSATLSDPILRTEEAEQYLRFTRTATGAGLITINQSATPLPAGSFDVRLWLRTVSAETSCKIGLRLGMSQAAGDNKNGASFTSTSGAWKECMATLVVNAASNWTLTLLLGNGSVADLIDVKLGSIMPAGFTPFFGDQPAPVGSTDFYYWEGATNASRSIRTKRTLSNVPGLYYTEDNLTTFTITENANPLAPNDTSGGATTVQLGVEEFEESMLLGRGELTVFQNGQAVVQGEIDSPSSDGDTVSITSMSIIAHLNVVRRVQPFTGSLDGYIAMLLAAVGITRPVVADLGIAERPIIAQGFKDNLLSRVKEFCAAQGVELSDLGDAVYLREPRTRTLKPENATETSISADSGQLAQSIEVVNYNSIFAQDALVYPPATYDDSTGASTEAGWTSEAPILTVDSGAVTVLEVPLQASLISVEQPVCMKEVGPLDGVGGSVYTVIGQGSNDGGNASIETLDPAEWTSRGGSVTVKVGDNFDSLIITIAAGSNAPSLAPFAIAMSSHEQSYSSLRIRGTGVINRKEKISYPTSLGPNDTTTEVGTTIDSSYVQNRAMADRVAAEMLPGYSRPTVTISLTLDNPGLPIGDIAGSRFRRGDSFYRVTSATSGESGVSVNASADTLIPEFDGIWSAKSFADFDAVWQHRTFEQFGASPLRDR